MPWCWGQTPCRGPAGQTTCGFLTAGPAGPWALRAAGDPTRAHRTHTGGSGQSLTPWLPCCGSCDQAAAINNQLVWGSALDSKRALDALVRRSAETSEASWHRNAPVTSSQGVSIAATERWLQCQQSDPTRKGRGQEPRGTRQDERAGAEQPERRGLGWPPPKHSRAARVTDAAPAAGPR